jgi:multiple antibiotic resistance protein
MDKETAGKLLIKSMIIAFLLLFTFTLFGRSILYLFSIDLYDFRVAGGLLLFIISLQMIFGLDTQGYTSRPLGIVPLATPLLAGPGAVTAAIVMSGTTGIITTALACAAVFIISYYLLKLSKYLLAFTGKEFMDVLAKVIGLILAAISIHYIREGIIGIYIMLR